MKKLLIISLFLLIGYSQGVAGIIKGHVIFSKSDIQMGKIKDFDVITLADCDITRRIGEPQLPVRLVHIVLPPGTKVKDFQVTSLESQRIKGVFNIYPAQPPQILSKKEKIEFIEPKVEIYSSSFPYPQQVIEYVGTGSMGGCQLAGFLVYPLQYIPAKKQLLFYPRIEFSLTYTSTKETPRIIRPLESSYRQAVEQMVLNPEDVDDRVVLERFGPSFLSPERVEYVIITHKSFVQGFQPLADWKTKKGIPTKIVTTDEIYSTYEGRDIQERIRNFIRDAWQSWGISWVLLGGDTNIIPTRTAFAMDCKARYSPVENDIPCDLYYSDLDGTWDANGNGVYGEVDDQVDLYPDVWVGRAPVENITEVNALVNKILNYEKPPVTDYFLRILFAAEILWPSPYTDSGIGKDMIDEESIPARFDPITKLYQSLGNENLSTVITAINQGQHLINHDGHAWYFGMSVGEGFLTASDMDALNNCPRYSILYSIGCWPAAFDYDCVAEHFLTNPNGGGVAFIGNSRYGWGSPGNPGYGYSDRFDRQFYKVLFQGHITHIGATLATAKAYYAPRSQQENVYRWHQYQLNLLGEPEMDIWTDTPKRLIVEHPTSGPLDSSPFTVTVTNGSDPIKGARVCVMDKGEVYYSGITDVSGQVEFDLSITTVDTLFVTVTAHNFLPYEGYATVFTGRPYVTYLEHRIDDVAGGNGDGIINPGESIKLLITLKNYGDQLSRDVKAVLGTEDTLVAMIDSVETYGDIAPTESLISPDGFEFSISSEAENGRVIPFTLKISDANNNSWTHALNLIVATPILICQGYTVNDSSGNGNGIPESGEEVEVLVTFKNKGLGSARGVQVSVQSTDPYLYIPYTLLNFVGDIQPTSEFRGSFSVNINELCPVPHFSLITLNIQTAGYDFPEGFVLGIGKAGFTDDMEGGEGNWLHGGRGDRWHLSERRSHSGTYSWYCGIEETGEYINCMNCYLVTPIIILGPRARLSFWHWYKVTTYGTDGLYVEIDAGFGWERLDFIGSGGALLDIGNDWLEDTYDLSSYPAGTPVRIRFRFFSDTEDISEGFYIDDVCVSSDYTHLSPLLDLVPVYFVDDDTLDESFGNANGFADPGEIIELPLRLRNLGDAMAVGVTAELDTRDPYITLLDNTETFGDIAPGEIAQSEDDFDFGIAADVPPHHPISFSLRIQDSRGNSWERSFTISVTPQPKIRVHSLSIDDDSLGESAGNANGYVDAGETIELIVNLENYGDGIATGIAAEIYTADPYTTLLDSVETYEDIGPAEVGRCDDDFGFKVSSDAPPNHLIPFLLRIQDSQGICWIDTFMIRVTQPELALYKLSVEDVVGDGDQIADPGEICHLYLHLRNRGTRDAIGIWATLSTDCDEITISDSTAIFSNIAVNSVGDNAGDPFILHISESIFNYIVPLNLHIIEGKGAYAIDIRFNLFLSGGEVLIVVDDGEINNSRYYTSALDKLGIPYEMWRVNINGELPGDTLMRFEDVIWFTGQEYFNTLTATDRENLKAYLDNGGNLFLSGQLIGFDIGKTEFYSEYLHANYISFFTQLHHLKGVEGNEVVGEMDISLATSGDNYQAFPGEIDPIPPAFSIFKYDTTTAEGAGDIRSSGTGALAVNTGTYKLVYFSFGFEGIVGFKNRVAVMSDIMSWFRRVRGVEEQPNQGIPLTFSLTQNYPNPFNEGTTIKYQLPKGGYVTLKIYNLLGQEVQTLVDGFQTPGYKVVNWDGRDGQGREAASGLYFYKLVVRSKSGIKVFTDGHKMLLLK